MPSIISCKNDELPKVEAIEDEITADSNILENGVPESDINNPLTITPDGSENYLNFDAEYIFDQESLHTFDLVLSEENLNLLNADSILRKISDTFSRKEERSRRCQLITLV